MKNIKHPAVPLVCGTHQPHVFLIGGALVDERKAPAALWEAVDVCARVGCTPKGMVKTVRLTGRLVLRFSAAIAKLRESGRSFDPDAIHTMIDIRRCVATVDDSREDVLDPLLIGDANNLTDVERSQWRYDRDMTLDPGVSHHWGDFYMDRITAQSLAFEARACHALRRRRDARHPPRLERCA